VGAASSRSHMSHMLLNMHVALTCMTVHRRALAHVEQNRRQGLPCYTASKIAARIPTHCVSTDTPRNIRSSVHTCIDAYIDAYIHIC
jgi:hypothetical protein